MEVLNYKEFRVTNEMLASNSKRFVNYLIDSLLFYLFFFLIGSIIAMIGILLGSEGVLQVLDNLENMNPILDRLISAIAFVIFYFILESISQKTIGKLITKTKVVLENGEKPNPETIIIRSLCRIIPFEPLSFFGNIPRGWHDTLSKTYVVDANIFEEHKESHRNYLLIGEKTTF